MSREHTRMRRRKRLLARKHGMIFRNLGRWAGWPRRRQRKALVMERKREWAKRGKIATIRRGQWGVRLTLTAKTEEGR